MKKWITINKNSALRNVILYPVLSYNEQTTQYIIYKTYFNALPASVL